MLHVHDLLMFLVADFLEKAEFSDTEIDNEREPEKEKEINFWSHSILFLIMNCSFMKTEEKAFFQTLDVRCIVSVRKIILEGK